MTTKYVQYCLRTKLNCALIPSAPVVLCIEDSALLASTACAEPAEGTYVGAFAQATICQAYTTAEGCGPATWYYTFAYDDALLADLNVPLTSGDITGVFCVDCLTNYFTYKIGSEIYIRDNEDGSQTLVTQHGCEYEINGGAVALTPVVNIEAISIAYGTLTNAYAVMGFLDVEGKAKQITIDNNTDVDIQISYDGVEDGPVVESGTVRSLDYAANGGILETTDVYIKYLGADAPTVGIVEVDGFY